MAADASSLKVFMEGTKQLLDPLTDEVDDEKATTTIDYALQAVGTDAEKLRSLIDIIYDKTTPHDDCSARLLVKLYDTAPDSISGLCDGSKGKVTLRGAKLVRRLVLGKCQLDFDIAMTSPVWPTKSIVVTVALFQAGLVGLEKIIKYMLEGMTEAEHLFAPQNFDEFARSCMTCGPKLDQGAKDDNLTKHLNKAWARATSESIGCKLKVAGLVATRENAWKIQPEATTQVLTPPESESEIAPEEDAET